MHDAIPLPQQMFQMITGFWVSQAVGTFAELGLADTFDGKPQTARDVASRAATDPDATFRLLRTLASVGVVAHGDGDRFELTPLGATLRSDVPGSMRDMARAQTMPGHWLPWGRLRDVVRTGTRQTGAALGAEIFGYYAEQPAERAAFLGAMDGLSMLVAAEAARVYDASAHRALCDVGGSAGTIAAGFLRANPKLRGTVFDLPEVAPTTKESIAKVGLAERCEAVGGDFFVDVPEADLYVLKHVLHDWNDAQCRTLLANVARRMQPGGRLLVIEMVIPDDRSPSAAQLMDLNMLVMLPGRERTAGQYAELFATAGLRTVDIRPTHSPMHVIVVEKVAS
jgi:hypothetical protein